MRSSASGLYRLVGVMIITVGLILLEPDLGCDCGDCPDDFRCFLPGWCAADSVYFLPDRDYICFGRRNYL